MPPAGQRLDAGNSPGCDGDLRLEDDVDLAAFDRMVKVGGQYVERRDIAGMGEAQHRAVARLRLGSGLARPRQQAGRVFCGRATDRPSRTPSRIGVAPAWNG